MKPAARFWLAVPVVAIVAVLALLSWREEPRPEPSPGRAASRIDAAPSPDVAPADPADAALRQNGAIAATPTPEESCGLPASSARPDADPDRQEKLALEDTKRWLADRDALLSAMVRAPDARTRAAALFLRGGRPRVDREVFDQACGSGAASAPSGHAAACAAMTVDLAVVAPAREALVTLALSARDPWVYALAVNACSGAEEPVQGSCALVNVDEWARLDPENAMPWFHVAQAALARGDMQARDAAMHRSSQAMRIEAPQGMLTTTLLRGLPPDATTYQRVTLAVEAVGTPGGARARLATMTWCKPPLDANRRQTCDEIARLFLERGRVVNDHMIGTALAERIGWPEEQIRALQRQRDAYLAALTRSQPTAWNSCEAYGTVMRHLEAVLEEGELAHARRRLASSGLGVAEAAEAWRNRADAAASGVPARPPEPTRRSSASAAR